MVKRKKQPSREKAAAAAPKRTKNHKTKTNPWEAASADETYEVEEVLASQYTLGVKNYEIKWVDYPETTWEPLSNLVGAVALIKVFEDARKQAEADAKLAAIALKSAR